MVKCFDLWRWRGVRQVRGSRCNASTKIAPPIEEGPCAKSALQQAIRQRGLPAEVCKSASRSIVTVVAMIPSEADHRAAHANADADEIPISRNPIAVCHVTGRPDISGAGARRNISDRTACVDSELGCLRRCRCHRRRARHHCCTQHPLLHAAHNPYLPAGSVSVISAQRAVIRKTACPGFQSALRLGSCCLCGLPVMTDSTGFGERCCGELQKINWRNFPANRGLWRLLQPLVERAPREW